jgi:hypothetical protein
MAWFSEVFARDVLPLIQQGDHTGAAAAIEACFPTLENEFERSEGYHWLASLAHVQATLALRRDDITEARSHFGDVQEFSLKALDEFPERPDTRTFLARFYLAPLGQPERAFPLLNPFGPTHRLDADSFAFYNHVRLVLRGVTLALIGSTEEAFEDWAEAYGEAALSHGVTDRLDTASLYLLIAAGITLPAEDLSRLLARLGELGVDHDRINQLRTRLSQPG